MPDLIIKPTATSGNKLILQDQAGGAVLTTADSGATIANATLTTPTIASMANCTFPTGVIINVTTDIYTSEPATNNTSFAVIDSTNFSVTVTPKSTASKFFIIVFLSGVDAGDWAQFDIYRSISGGATTQNISSQTYGLAGVYSALLNDSPVTYFWLDSPSTTASITYAPSAKSTSSSHNWNINDSGNSSRITVFEIA